MLLPFSQGAQPVLPFLGQRLELWMKGLSEGLYTLLEINMSMIGPQAGSNGSY